MIFYSNTEAIPELFTGILFLCFAGRKGVFSGSFVSAKAEARPLTDAFSFSFSFGGAALEKNELLALSSSFFGALVYRSPAFNRCFTGGIYLTFLANSFYDAQYALMFPGTPNIYKAIFVAFF